MITHITPIKQVASFKRYQKALESIEVKTVEDLEKYSRLELLGYRGLGPSFAVSLDIVVDLTSISLKSDSETPEQNKWQITKVRRTMKKAR